MLKVYSPILLIGLIIGACFEVQAEQNKKKENCKREIEEACERAGRMTYASCVDRNFSSKEDCNQLGQWVEYRCKTVPKPEEGSLFMKKTKD